MALLPLAPAEVEYFRREGYLFRQEFMFDEVTELQNMVASLLSTPQGRNPRITMHSALDDPDFARFPNNPYATYHVVNTVLAGDNWLSLMADHRIIDTVCELLSPSADLDMSFLRMRPSGLRMEAPWHRDADTDKFDDYRGVTSLIYLHDMTAASGATRVIPASRGYSHRNLESQNVSVDELESAAIPIEQPAGTVLYLSSKVVHRGDWNRTQNESGVLAFEYRARGNNRHMGIGEDPALTDLPVARPGWRLSMPSHWISSIS
jgi:hypothetical protein